MPQPQAPEAKKPHVPTAQPIQAPFEDEYQPEIETEQRPPADALEHFRKHQCANGHKNWDEKKIVYSMDNKRWILKCLTCTENRTPSWFTITGSAMAVIEAAGRMDNAPVQK